MAELIDNSNYQDFTLETLKTPDGITRLNSIIRQISQNISSDGESVKVYQGVGTPEASIAAGVGSLYMRTDGAADTSVYRKESGSGNTGWVAIKTPASLPLSVANGGFGSDNSAIAQGYIPYMSATGVISWLAVGTSGYFLKTQGAGANPIWAAGSNLVLRSTTAWSGFSSGDISITNTKQYLVKTIITSVTADTVYIRINNDSTANKYGYVLRGFDIAAAAHNANSDMAATEIPIASAAITATAAQYGYIDFNIAPQAGTGDVNIMGTSYGVLTAAKNAEYNDFVGRWNNSAAATSFRITGTTGTITATTYLYEITTT